MHHFEDCFSNSYEQARRKFRHAAGEIGATVKSFVVPGIGSWGETLTTEVATLPSRTSTKLLIVTSGTHGAEGFCGSACQLDLMKDPGLLTLAQDNDITILLVHAVNPYGFSWVSRTDEDNVDLNRNALAFSSPLDSTLDHGYEELHHLLLPERWPFSPDNRNAIDEYVDRHGLAHFQSVVMRGQHSHADGIFFGGLQRSRSLLNLEEIFSASARRYDKVGWIDIHTGLGRNGHGEKIYAGRPDADGVARASKWWGTDLAVPFQGSSTAAEVTGQLANVIYETCPLATHTLLGLEFGTVDLMSMINALRAENWLRAQQSIAPEVARLIRQQVRDAFYCANPLWKGSVLGQSRTVTLQALTGLSLS